MSYLVLARKARPQTFEQVIGQRPVVTTLRNSIIRKRVAHAILFSGVRGVGKTTLARIMAKAINCQAEPANRPCDECDSCRQIAGGSSLDLHEIDGASNRGIQEIRELKEKIRFLPTTSAYKIIIIDEVHMLTTEAFNALLKTLEEPPAHVYFMFATTEIHKIPITILSRCQQYELKRIPARELYDHFQNLVAAENFEIETTALSLIVREAGGSVRDGLSLLDQMFSYGEKKITNTDVVEVLGLVNRDVLMRLTKALLENSRKEVFLSLDEIFGFGMDLKRFVEDLMDHFRTLLLCKIDGCSALIDLPGDELTDFQKLAADYTSETLHLKLTLLMGMAEDLKFSAQPRLTLETSFLKILEAGNVVPMTSLLGQMDKLLAALPDCPAPLADSLPVTTAPEIKKKAEPAQPAVNRQETVASTSSEAIASSQPRSQESVTGQPSIANQKAADNAQNSSQEKSQTESAPSLSPQPQDGHSQLQSQETVPPPPPPPELNEPEIAHEGPPETPKIQAHEKDIRKDWPQFINYVKDRTMWMAQDLQRAEAHKQTETGELHLSYNDAANCSLLRQKENHQLLTEFVLDFFQKPLKVKFIVPEFDDSPDANGEDSPHKKRQQLANDPLVIMATEIFTGQVGDIRIGPRSR